MGTRNRKQSVTFKIPDTPKYKFYNVTDFRGLEISENPFDTSNGSASDVLNLYVDEGGALSTRPRVALRKNISSLPNFKELINATELENVIIYQVKLLDDSVAFVKDVEGVLTLLDSSNVELSANKYSIFENEDKIYLLGGENKYFVVKTDDKLYDVYNDADTYCPVCKIGSITSGGITYVDDETENILSSKEYTDFLWDMTSDLSEIYTNGVGVYNHYWFNYSANQEVLNDTNDLSYNKNFMCLSDNTLLLYPKDWVETRKYYIENNQLMYTASIYSSEDVIEIIRVSKNGDFYLDKRSNNIRLLSKNADTVLYTFTANMYDTPYRNDCLISDDGLNLIISERVFNTTTQKYDISVKRHSRSGDTWTVTNILTLPNVAENVRPSLYNNSDFTKIVFYFLVDNPIITDSYFFNVYRYTLASSTLEPFASRLSLGKDFAINGDFTKYVSVISEGLRITDLTTEYTYKDIILPRYEFTRIGATTLSINHQCNTVKWLNDDIYFMDTNASKKLFIYNVIDDTYKTVYQGNKTDYETTEYVYHGTEVSANLPLDMTKLKLMIYVDDVLQEETITLADAINQSLFGGALRYSLQKLDLNWTLSLLGTLPDIVFIQYARISDEPDWTQFLTFDETATGFYAVKKYENTQQLCYYKLQDTGKIPGIRVLYEKNYNVLESVKNNSIHFTRGFTIPFDVNKASNVVVTSSDGERAVLDLSQRIGSLLNNKINYVIESNNISVARNIIMTQHSDYYTFIYDYLTETKIPKTPMTGDSTQMFDNKYWFYGSNNKIFRTQATDPTYIGRNNYYDVGESSTNVTGINILNYTAMVVYKPNRLYVVSPITVNNLQDYSFTEFKSTEGNVAKNAQLISPYNEYPIHISDTGIYSLQNIENIASSDQSVVSLSKPINVKFLAENKTNMLSTKYLYWSLFVIPGSTSKIYILDDRKSDWFYWEIPFNVVSIWTKETKIYLADNNGLLYVFDKADIVRPYDTEYYDYGKKLITWKWISQINALGSINYLKQLKTTTFILTDTDESDGYALNYKFNIFRDLMTQAEEITEEDTINYVRSVTKRTYLSKLHFLQIVLSNITDTYLDNCYKNNKIKLIGMSYKYLLTGGVV